MSQNTFFQTRGAASHPSRQRGMTLVETMIAITISLILLAGVLQIFIGNKQTYRVQDAVARLQESGRFAVRFLTKDLRMAGFMGCASINSMSNPPTNMADLDGDGVADTVAAFDGDGLQGWESSQLPVALSDTQNLNEGTAVGQALPGTDIISIKRASDTGVRLTGNMATVNANIQLLTATVNGMFATDDILMVTNCENSDIFAANNVSNGAGTTTIAHSNAVNIGNFLSTSYGTDAEVMQLENTAYFVGNNDKGIPSLFRMEMGNAGVLTTQELIEGVDDMQILYGEDTDGDRTADVYRDATAVADMRQVVSVRIALTIRTIEDNIATVTDATYNDKRLRRTFTTTVTLRNRVI
ncbi:MAG TPA: prepilin-type N-terminal cleavage/methylation domain-containing protein [Gammaproteobacteria bacterium]|nr:prepilin-type N-terminal cleavage/methylation domain-containing protein [Gammaproteobacteria bacterium]